MSEVVFSNYQVPGRKFKIVPQVRIYDKQGGLNFRARTFQYKPLLDLFTVEIFQNDIGLLYRVFTHN